MKLEKLLAENMLRFGTKNLIVSDIKPYLTEQTMMPLDKIQKLIETDKINKGSLQISQKQGQCVFIKSPSYNTVELEINNIQAQFYNNMVSLQRGLMPETSLQSVTDQINKIIKDIKTNGMENVQIEIIGTATSQPASDNPDTRLLAVNPAAALDHPGGQPYGGATPNNNYLAQQRANSIAAVFKTLLPTAKYTINSQVIPGGSRDDASRYIQVKIKGDKLTADAKTFNDIYLTWQVSYISGEATSNEQGLKKLAGDAGSAYSVSTKPVPAYQASIKISFGQKSTPQFAGEFAAKSLEQIPNIDQQLQSYVLQNPKRMTSNRYKWIQKVPTRTSETGPFLGAFLQSCGYLSRDLANKLDNYVAGAMLDVTSDVFKKLAEKGTGNLQDFMSIVGGSASQQLTPDFTFGAKLYDVTTTPPTLTKMY
jgi:hypothetical protein